MKKTYIGILVIQLCSFFNPLQAGIGFRTPDVAVIIVNASAVPLEIINPTKTGGTCVVDKSNESCITASGPISVPSGGKVIPVENRGTFYEAFYPNYTASAGLITRFGKPFEAGFTGAKTGWQQGIPIVRHKGKQISINKPGYWVFSDHGVYYAHQDPKTKNIVAGAMKGSRLL